MKIMRKLQSLAAPDVATLGSKPVGRNFFSAASGTTKSSCMRASALCSTKVSAFAEIANAASAAPASSMRNSLIPRAITSSRLAVL